MAITTRKLSNSRGTYTQIPLLKTLPMFGLTHPLPFRPPPHLFSRNIMFQFPSRPMSHTPLLHHLKYRTSSTVLSPSLPNKRLGDLRSRRLIRRSSKPLLQLRRHPVPFQRRKAPSHQNQSSKSAATVLDPDTGAPGTRSKKAARQVDTTVAGPPTRTLRKR